MEGKTLVWNRLEVIWLDNLAGRVLDPNIGAIEVFHDEVDSGKSLLERNLMFNEQISALSLESLMGLLLHDDNDISGLLTWELISFSMESVLAIVGGTNVD